MPAQAAQTLIGSVSCGSRSGIVPANYAVT